MKILNIILSSIGSIIVLFVLSKLIGNKQISNMTLFDYINGITIGSIAAEMATALEGDFLLPLTAMIIYGLASLAISCIATKSIKLRRFLIGRSIILLDNGKLYKKNLMKARLDINEFLTQCRVNGYFNLADIQTAIIEPNGMISILPVSDKRPVNPQDLNLSPDKERIVTNVVIDGKIIYKNLKSMGKEEEWLRKQLKDKWNISISDAFLVTYDSNRLDAYVKLNDKPVDDPFQ
ncbi:MAG: DUF421 domain-containing protein [Clostridiales bacterium]|jgi:uncharacterized membrane protein YcaP (DUF421 family)|nr:DUF421 domain-containing protein [Clostridiales bacterium]